MNETIRKIEVSDFEKVSALYENKKSVEELKWLFTDPDNKKIYNAFVVVNESEELLGVIGYCISIYSDDKNFIKGVIPMSWKIADQYKGFAGVQLLKKVLSLAEFGIAIQGSETAKQLYPLFKYRFLSTGFEYYKILNLKNVFLSLKRTTPIKTFGMLAYLLPTLLNQPSKNQYSKYITFIPYKRELFIDGPEYMGIFRKRINSNYIDWLLGCPKVKTYGFSIQFKDKCLGTCVLYIQKTGNFYKGRIVHLPFLGYDQNLWVAVIDQCIEFFKKKNCCLITGFAHNKINKSIFLESGFLTWKNFGRDVFVKDTMNKLSAYDLENWYLQYSEGDKAYRI